MIGTTSELEAFLPSLIDYFYGRGHDDIAEAITTANSLENPRVIPKSQIDLWLARCESADDIVALASTAFRYADRSDKSVFTSVSRKLENLRSVSGASHRTPDDWLRSITVISAAHDGPHLKVVYSYIAALLTVPSIQEVNLIFTGEWHWRMWSRSDQANRMTRFYEDFFHQLKRYHGGKVAYFLFKRKLKIHLSPRLEEYKAIIKGLILRFEGPAPFKTTYITGKDLNKSYPVVTATFSSFVVQGKNSSATLVRQKRVANSLGQHPTFFYDAPFAVGKVSKTISREKRSGVKAIISVYSGNRIEQMFRLFSGKQIWGDLIEFFHRNPKFKWVFIGAANPEQAKSLIPNDEKSKVLREKIEVVGHSDLSEYYKYAYVYISVPNVFGGGHAAWSAIAHNIPVLCSLDQQSDVSNTLDEQYQFKDLESIFGELSFWVEDPTKRAQILRDQRSVLRSRKQIFKKGRELHTLLMQCLAKYEH